MNYTISHYLLARLQEVGIKHLFGVAGDYVLDFLDNVITSPIRWIGACNELNAGYAADGYARLNGVGAAVVTYSVGGLSILNAVAGAYAEQVPLIVVSGAPPTHRRSSGALVHHLVANYQMQHDIFAKITADAALLDDPATAPALIDRVITNCLARNLPVYLELPADRARTPCAPPQQPLAIPPRQSDPDSLAKAVEEAAALLGKAHHPLILMGVELNRQRLGAEALRLVEKAEIPFAAMLSSKSLLPEFHPQFVGIYQGAWSAAFVRQQVEQSDCILSLGAWMTDLDTGLFTVRLEENRTISASAGHIQIGANIHRNVALADFIARLAANLTPRAYQESHPNRAFQPRKPFTPQPDRALSASRLYEALDAFLDDDMVLLAEPGDAFCAAPSFHIEEADNFIVQPYYASIGYCTPAALGAALARPNKRPVVLTGDGALQMTAQEISSHIRQKTAAIIIVINNNGYLIERVLHEDGLYNDIQPWRYHLLPAAFGDAGAGIGHLVKTEEELLAALHSAKSKPDNFHLIEAVLPPLDCSPTLQQLGQTYREMIAKKGQS